MFTIIRLENGPNAATDPKVAFDVACNLWDKHTKGELDSDVLYVNHDLVIAGFIRLIQTGYIPSNEINFRWTLNGIEMEMDMRVYGRPIWGERKAEPVERSVWSSFLGGIFR